MKIVIIGANGQLGQEFQSSHCLISLTHDDIEVTDLERTRSVLAEHKPEAVLNTAAFHRVEIARRMRQSFPGFAPGAPG